MKQPPQAVTPGGGAYDLGEVLEFMRLLWGLEHGLRAASKQMEARLGVTGPQRLVIRIVGRFPGISAGQIAQILHVHPSTLTGVLSRLDTAGFLARRQDPEDGRRALFDLTPRGQEIDATRTGTAEAKVQKALEKMSRQKLTAARDVLAKLTRALEEQ